MNKPIKLSRSPKLGQFRGSDTFSWELETTGASAVDFQEVTATDDGTIGQIILTFPAGSEFQYYVRLYVDGAQVFPSKLSTNLKGDNQTKKYNVSLPFTRGSVIRVEMVSNTGLADSVEKACWVDLTLKYQRRPT